MFKYSQTVLSYLAVFMDKDSTILDKEGFENMVPDIVKEKQKQFDQSIYFENLYIDDMNIKFSFFSNPEFLNQTQLNSTLKFLVAMLMNLKHLELHFRPFNLFQDPVSIPVFISNLKNHYLSDFYSHKQLFRILSSLGLFGNLQDTLNNFVVAFKSLVANPSRNGSIPAGIAQNFLNFFRHALYAVSSTVTEIAEAIFRGLNAILNATQASSALDKKAGGNDLDDKIIDINSHAGVLDTQNKIWLNSFIKEELQIQKADHEKIVEIVQQEVVIVEGQGDVDPNHAHHPNKTEFTKRQKLFNIKHKIEGKAVRIKQIPIAILYTFYQMLKSINQYIKIDRDLAKDKRIRFPRYFGYTKALEPYAIKKSFAVETLKRLNLSLSQTENNAEVILTENRILCVTQGDSLEDLRFWSLVYTDILSCEVYKLKQDPENSETESDGQSSKNLPKVVLHEEIVSQKGDKPLKNGMNNQDAKPMSSFKAKQKSEDPNEVAKEGVKVQLEILHFNDHFNYNLHKTEKGGQITNGGFADFKFHKKILSECNDGGKVTELHQEIMKKMAK